MAPCQPGLLEGLGATSEALKTRALPVRPWAQKAEHCILTLDLAIPTPKPTPIRNLNLQYLSPKPAHKYIVSLSSILHGVWHLALTGAALFLMFVSLSGTSNHLPPGEIRFERVSLPYSSKKPTMQARMGAARPRHRCNLPLDLVSGPGA